MVFTGKKWHSCIEMNLILYWHDVVVAVGGRMLVLPVSVSTAYVRTLLMDTKGSYWVMG